MNCLKSLDLCVFDFGVNANCWQFFQVFTNNDCTVADGGIGPNTLKKLGEYVESLVLKMQLKDTQETRQKYYEGLSTFSTFGRGCTRRVDETTEPFLSMVA